MDQNHGSGYSEQSGHIRDLLLRWSSYDLLMHWMLRTKERLKVTQIPGLSHRKEKDAIYQKKKTDKDAIYKNRTTWNGKYSWEKDQELIRNILSLMSGRQSDK